MAKKLYAVMAVHTDIEVTTETGKTKHKLGGCYGYLPVFTNKRDAKKASKISKCEIMEIFKTKI